MYRPAICIILFFTSLSLTAQYNERAGELYSSGYDNYLAGELEKAAKDILKAIDLENGEPLTDSLFIGDSKALLGDIYWASEQYYLSKDNYQTAYEIYARESDTLRFDLIPIIGDIYESFYKKDQEIPTDRNTEIIYHRIIRYLGRLGDTVYFRIAGGSIDGIYINEEAGVLSNDTDDDNERGNIYLGDGFVTNIWPDSAEAYIVLKYPEQENMNVWVGDNFLSYLFRDPNRYNSLIQNLASTNIIFNDLYGNSFYSRRQLQHWDSPQLEKDIIQMLTKDLRKTGYWINTLEEKDTAWINPLTKGRFVGRNIIQLLEETTPLDVMAFLRFADAFPGKYMKRTWKISETYATWAISDSPSDEDYNWLIDSLEAQGLIRMSGFASKYHFYFDTSAMNLILDRIGVYADNSNWEKLKNIIDLGSIIDEYTNYPGYEETFRENEAYYYSQIGNKYKSIELYTELINRDPDYSSHYWNRSFVYADMDQYDLAIEDCRKIIEIFPDFASGYGNAGWYHLLHGDIDGSLEYLEKAKELDPEVMSWTVNLGHYHLLKGNPEKAHAYYDQTLKLIETVVEFEEGPVADFDIFIKKGWQTNAIKKEKEWMVQKFEEEYKSYILSEEKYYSGKDLKDAEEYEEAALHFISSVSHEKDSKNPRNNWIHYSITWAGWCYQQIGEYDKALKYYQEGFDASIKNLPDDDIANDLELLGSVYLDMGKMSKSDASYEQADAIRRKLADQNKSNNLFIISIGINNYPKFQFDYAESDAQKVADSFKLKSRLLFDNTYSYVLTGNRATRDSIEFVFRRAILTSRPGDTFILFFAGKSDLSGQKFFLLPYNESKKAVPVNEFTAISADLLMTWLSQLPADKQFLVLDAAATKFIDHYIRIVANKESLQSTETDDGLNTLSEKNVLLFSPSVSRIEKTSLKQSLLTHALLTGLSGDANVGNPVDTMISAKEMDAHLFKYLSSYKYYFRNQNYSNGLDFKLAFSSKSDLIQGMDTVPPAIFIVEPVQTRGNEYETNKQVVLVKGQVWDSSPIKKITINGDEVLFKQNGKFEYGQQLALGSNIIELMAEDMHGNRSEEHIMVVRKQFIEKQKATIRVGIQKGRNYALLIATDKYEEWSDLSNPVHDAETIGDELKEYYGFDSVRIVRNPKLYDIHRIIQRYQNHKFGDNDQLMIFFAGHGVYDGKKGYLVASDSKKSSEIYLDYLNFPTLREDISNIQCNHIFLLLDVCHGGALMSGGFGARGNGDNNLTAKEIYEKSLKLKTRIFLTSGGAEYQVSDGRPGSHSPFATIILQNLREKGPSLGYISANGLFSQMERLPTKPVSGQFSYENEPGSNFIFLYRSLTVKERELK